MTASPSEHEAVTNGEVKVTGVQDEPAYTVGGNVFVRYSTADSTCHSNWLLYRTCLGRGLVANKMCLFVVCVYICLFVCCLCIYLFVRSFVRLFVRLFVCTLRIWFATQLSIILQFRYHLAVCNNKDIYHNCNTILQNAWRIFTFKFDTRWQFISKGVLEKIVQRYSCMYWYRLGGANYHAQYIYCT